MRLKKYKDLPKKLSEILKRDKSIKEVILSGGDPLMLSDNEIKAFLRAIPKNLKIRVHSRIPITMPQRFTPALFSLFKKIGERMIFVAHVNHANELDSESKKIFKRLAEYGILLLNQSVFLKGVNDSAACLAELSEKLFSQRVLPYYLHVLDKAKGASHFDVPASKAKEVFEELKGLLPGYLVPRLAKEEKGGRSKIWIGGK
jgi:KamA family protein